MQRAGEITQEVKNINRSLEALENTAPGGMERRLKGGLSLQKGAHCYDDSGFHPALEGESLDVPSGARQGEETEVVS